jgi:RNA polymerase sigma factor (sigma-70 family)
VLLERLLIRDGLSGDEAIERLRTEHGLSLSPEEVAGLAAIPRRPGRQRVGEEELIHIAVDGQVEVRVEEKERARAARRLRELLVPLLRSLPAEDRRLLRMCYFEGLSVATIAPILGRPQKELYKVRDRCLKQIRRSLVAAGLGSGQIRELIGRLQGSLGLERSLSGR